VAFNLVKEVITLVNDDVIIIRPAKETDIEEIQKVLHSEGKMWTITKIAMHINKIFILTYQNKIISVLYGNSTADKFEISWVIVHPMYPENSIRIAMHQAIGGVLMRQPVL
jgi:N-acetylglutamate synthase-like GNAT family acetyltransferase